MYTGTTTQEQRAIRREWINIMLQRNHKSGGIFTLREIIGVVREQTLEHVDIIASGYEWNCPNCGQNNRTYEVTGFVVCDECRDTYAINPPEHAWK